MSEIRATTISDAAGTGPITLTGQSAAKAWIHFQTSGGTSLYTPTLNISSVTDNGTGNTTVTMTNAFNGTNEYNTCGADDFYGMCNCGETSGRSSSAFRVYSYNNSHSLVDSNHTSVSMFGDLA